MATNNVDFYVRMQGLQKKLHQSEHQRMELECKFDAYLSSDKRLSRLNTAKLQRLWQKVCEDEKRSKIRNQQLLTDYHRVESHVSALSTRTERLRQLKDQYERQVELMYPRWKEQIEARRLQQQLDQHRKQQQGGSFHGQGQPLSNGAPYIPQHLHQPQSLHHNGATDIGAASPQYQSSPLSSSAQIPNAQTQYAPQMVGYNGQRMSEDSRGHASWYDTSGRPASRNQPAVAGDGAGGSYTPLGVDPRHGLEPGFDRQQPHVVSGNASYPAQIQQYGNQHSQPSGFQQRQQQQPYHEQQQHHHPQQQVLNQQLQQQPNQQQRNHDMEQQQYQQQPRQDQQQHHQQQNFSQQQQQQQYVKPEAIPQNHPQNQNQYRPKADSVGETSSTISVSSDSHYSGVDIQPKVVITSTHHQETKHTGKPPAHSNADSGGTATLEKDQNQLPRNKDHASDYLTPITVNGEKEISTQPHSAAAPVQRPSSRAGQQGRLPVSSRTEPFSSEGEQVEEEEEEDSEGDSEDESEDDEDSAELRSALEKQLATKTTEIPVVKIEVTMHDNSDTQKVAEPDTQSSDRPAAENDRHQVNQQVHKVPSSNPAKDSDSEEGEESDDDSEIGSDMSLPLSGDTAEGGSGSKDKMAGDITWKAGPDSMGTTNSRNSDSVATSPAVTTKGFWLLTHAVEIEIEQSDNISGIYNSPNCTDAIKGAIIKSANENGRLSHLDPNAISMVIIQMLPSIVESLPGGCLMSDKMLGSKRPINEVTVRSFIYSAALGFWDKLLRHLEFLVKKGVFEPDEVASKFAPLMIDPESSMADKAVDVLCKLLEDVQGDDSYQDESSSMTLPTPSPSPRKPTDTREEENQQHLKVPRLNLGDTSDASDDDSFFESKVPLTETNAYQKMLGNTFTSDTAKPRSTREDGDNNNMGEEESEGFDSSSEDEIEKAARITPTSPSASNRKKRNVLSSLGGSLGLTNRSDEEEEEEDDDDNKLKVTGGSTRRSDQVSSAADSDIASSPSPPGTGYIPSAMEHSMKSTARSDPMQRSAAFWGEESDMDESEMSIPMGTGTKSAEDDKDDFDFYD